MLREEGGALEGAMHISLGTVIFILICVRDRMGSS